MSHAAPVAKLHRHLAVRRSRHMARSEPVDLVTMSLFIQVTDESGTYIIEPVSGEEYYSEDPNIMWIQETVEVEQESYDNLPNMVSL
jgi:hypothetical protein